MFAAFIGPVEKTKPGKGLGKGVVLTAVSRYEEGYACIATALSRKRCMCLRKRTATPLAAMISAMSTEKTERKHGFVGPMILVILLGLALIVFGAAVSFWVAAAGLSILLSGPLLLILLHSVRSNPARPIDVYAYLYKRDKHPSDHPTTHPPAKPTDGRGSHDTE